VFDRLRNRPACIIALGAVLATLVAGCGGGATTVKEGQATPSCAQSATTAFSKNCQKQLSKTIASQKGKQIVIDCGGGLTTNGSCDFARAVKSQYGQIPGESGLVVRGNPLRCTLSGSGWVCRSTISTVYVAYK
jgi:hypothetical protein